MNSDNAADAQTHVPHVLKTILAWAALALAIIVPIAVAAMSPQLEWREPVYIAAGFAGIIAMGLLLVQPLLVGGYLPGLRRVRGRKAHRWIGVGLLSTVIIHVGALWITSPPDVIDALLFRSPTPFSLWGVIGMWAVFAAALLAAFRRRLQIPRRLWRLAHALLAMSIVATSTAHAMLIEGTMGTASKVMLCALAIGATCWAVKDLRSLTWIARWLQR